MTVTITQKQYLAINYIQLTHIHIKTLARSSEKTLGVAPPVVGIATLAMLCFLTTTSNLLRTSNMSIR